MPLLTTLAPPSAVASIPLQLLTAASFAPFGSVITRPLPPLPPPVVVNQGTALKYTGVSFHTSSYPSSPPASTPINLFVCSPRTLSASGHFVCTILERHPLTSQSFIPLGLATGPQELRRYIVIVAPTLSDGSGMPDLTKLCAFEGRGDKGVTYNPGTWHAPMVVVGGEREIEFVVVNGENGTGVDCEEVAIGGEGIRVGVEMGAGLWTKGMDMRKPADRAKL